MKELKQALMLNYGKGLAQEDLAALASDTVSVMRSSGETVGEAEIAAVLKTIHALSESEEVKENGERILKLIEEVPKFGMIFRKWMLLQEMWPIHIRSSAEL